MWMVGRERERESLACSAHPFFFHSSDAILYISFVNATKSYGCRFFDDLLPAIIVMKPLASLYAVAETVDDFGSYYFEPFGDFPAYQDSGLSLTMINMPSWQRVEEILSSQVNVTASMTPCKRSHPFSFFLLTSNFVSFCLNRCRQLHCICPISSSQGVSRGLRLFICQIPFALLSFRFHSLFVFQGVGFISAVVQLVRKAIKRELDMLIPTVIYIFVALTCLFRILENAIDPENFLNVLSLGTRMCLFWLVRSWVFHTVDGALKSFCVFIAGLLFWLSWLRADFNLMVSFLCTWFGFGRRVHSFTSL